MKLTDLSDVHELYGNLLVVFAVDAEVNFAKAAFTKQLVDDIVVKNHTVVERLS